MSTGSTGDFAGEASSSLAEQENNTSHASTNEHDDFHVEEAGKQGPSMSGYFIPVVPRNEELDALRTKKKQMPVPLLRPRASRKYNENCEEEMLTQQTRLDEEYNVKDKPPQLTLCEEPSESTEEAYAMTQEENGGVVTPQSPPSFPFPFPDSTPTQPLRLQMKQNSAANPFHTEEDSLAHQPIHRILKPPDEPFVSPSNSEGAISYSTPKDNVSECLVDSVPSPQFHSHCQIQNIGEDQDRIRTKQDSTHGEVVLQNGKKESSLQVSRVGDEK